MRQFLVSWIALLDSVPDAGLLRFLDRLLGPLLDYLADPQREVRAATETLLRELMDELRETARRDASPGAPCDITAIMSLLIARSRTPRPPIETLATCQWAEACLHVDAHAALRSNFRDLLQFVLQCVGAQDAATCALATRLSAAMRAAAERGALVAAELPLIFAVLERELRSVEETTRLEALYWVRCIIRIYATDASHRPAPAEVDPSSLSAHISGLIASMTESLFATDDRCAALRLFSVYRSRSFPIHAVGKPFNRKTQNNRYVKILDKKSQFSSLLNARLVYLRTQRVVTVAGDILEGLASAPPSNYDRILSGLVTLFRTDEGGPNAALMSSKGTRVIRDLMGRLGPERVLVRLAEIVHAETGTCGGRHENDPAAQPALVQSLRCASFWAQSLNWLLLTAPELEPLRSSLKAWKVGIA